VPLEDMYSEALGQPCRPKRSLNMQSHHVGEDSSSSLARQEQKRSRGNYS